MKWAWQRQGGMRNVSGSSGFGFSTRLLEEAAERIIATVVDGEVVMEGDKHTGTLPPPRVKQHLLPREPRLIDEA